MNEILVSAYRAWRSGAELRERRRRMKDYTYGRQWGDRVVTPEGELMTEGEYASQSGKTPLTNNMIRQLVKSVVGRFRHELPSLGGSGVDAEISRRNLLDELDSRMLEEFLISGCAIQRVGVEKRIYGEGVWVDNVAPDRFFVNRFTDPRSIDIELVGQLHDMSVREVIMRFGHGDTQRQRSLEAMCDPRRNPVAPLSVGEPSGDGEAFFRPEDPTRCRLIEVWTLESRNILKCHDRLTAHMFQLSADGGEAVGRINRRRRRRGEPEVAVKGTVTARWRCRWFTPAGDIVAEYDSPYAHGLHPFAVKFYPMTDGEVHSFVEDIVDQQRYINRLITLVDHIMSFSAKGVLLLPVESIPSDVAIEDICREWSRPNGVLPYLGRGGCEPKQIVAGGGNAGASELLSLEMKMMERISGVSTALQGQTPDANTSATAYDNSIKNATIALLDIFSSFVAFRDMRNRLITGV